MPLPRQTHSFAAAEAAALGDQLLAELHPCGAIEAFEVATGADPGNPYLLMGLAEACLAADERRRAHDIHREVLAILPGFAWPQNGLGLSAESLDAAELHFRRAAEVEPGEPIYRGNLAWCLYHLDLRAESVQYFLQVQGERPADLGYATALASILAEDEHVGEAEFCLRRTLDTVEWCEGSDEKGWYMYRLRAFDEAEKLFHRVRGFDFDLAAAYAMHGRLALAADRAQSAVQSLKRAVVLSPRSERFHSDLSRAYAAIGDSFLADAARTRAGEMRRARKRSTADIAGWADSLVEEARRRDDSGTWRLSSLVKAA